MFKSVKVLSAACVFAAFIGGSASAATLSLSGGTNVVLGANFNPAPVTGVVVGDSVTNFSGLGGGGLSVSGPAKVTFTFLGKEASYSNSAVELFGLTGLSDTTPGASISFTQVFAGLLNFKFSTAGAGGAFIVNGVGSANSNLDMAFTSIFNGGKSVIALFGDGGGGNDDDFDDMVVRIDVAAVPLPAGGVLLISALGGVAALRRRKAA